MLTPSQYRERMSRLIDAMLHFVDEADRVDALRALRAELDGVLRPTPPRGTPIGELPTQPPPTYGAVRDEKVRRADGDER